MSTSQRRGGFRPSTIFRSTSFQTAQRVRGRSRGQRAVEHVEVLAVAQLVRVRDAVAAVGVRPRERRVPGSCTPSAAAREILMMCTYIKGARARLEEANSLLSSLPQVQNPAFSPRAAASLRCGSAVCSSSRAVPPREAVARHAQDRHATGSRVIAISAFSLFPGGSQSLV